MSEVGELIGGFDISEECASGFCGNWLKGLFCRCIRRGKKSAACVKRFSTKMQCECVAV